jgi:15-cis-phytoene synthase
MREIDQSYEYCKAIARRRAKNFYYSFLLLSRQQRKAMCAIYAFMRRCDDLSDEPGSTREGLERWRAEMEDALQGKFSGHPIWPAFHHTVRRFGIPHQYLRDMVDGVTGDLEPRRFENFEELYRYCYQVASVVGLTIIHIFGFDTPSALPLAEKCGVAFQLTNILRDIHEDAERDRVYLPAEDLRRFGVREEELCKGERSPALIELLRFEGARAKAYYDQSLPLLDRVHARSRPSLWALITIYRSLLERIESSGYDVFARRIRLTSAEKSWILVRAMVG